MKPYSRTKLANELMRGSGIEIDEAARIVLEIVEQLGQERMDLARKKGVSPLQLCRDVVRHGIRSYRQSASSKSLQVAADYYWKSKQTRRPRTLDEIRQYCHRLFRHEPQLAKTNVRHITPEMSRNAIFRVFKTSATQRKARAILHSIFTYAMRQQWCDLNPIRAIDIEPTPEKRIAALPLRHIRKLLDTAVEREHRPCAVALGFMLWAGIRPQEVERLRWKDVHLTERVICIQAQHAKTGGERHVTIQPVLYEWLRRISPMRLDSAGIIPKDWGRRWQRLRKCAGMQNWQPDVLRHTFASYHLKHFRDLSALQLEMGHSSLALLRTRYLNQKGITADAASRFWSRSFAKQERGTCQG